MGWPAALLAGTLLMAAPGEPETIVHVVEEGDTLWSISGQPDVYADPYLWPLIYKFNRDQIQDPSRIYPSQKLLIPIHVDADTRRDTHLKAGAPSAKP